MKTEYILIPKSTLNAFNLTQEHILTPEEVLKLSIYKHLIAKFIRQKALAVQFDIGGGQCEGKESVYLEVVKVLNNLAKETEELDSLYKKYKTEMEEQEKQRIETEKLKKAL